MDTCVFLAVSSFVFCFWLDLESEIKFQSMFRNIDMVYHDLLLLHLTLVFNKHI